jgi:hypothetical protein
MVVLIETATIADYPRLSASVWDLVAQGVATALKTSA